MSIFFFGWILQSMVWAGLLYQMGVKGSWRKLGRHWQRLFIALIIPLVILPIFGWNPKGWLLCFAVFLIGEFHFRQGNWHAALTTLVPWFYLAICVQMAFFYNTAIVSVRHFNLYDPFFQHLDWVLFHVSVIRISHAASSLYIPAEVVYYAMPGAMGAALLFLGLAKDRSAAFDLAGAIAISYYISLLIFFLWPSNGPFSLDPVHLPSSMATASIQHASYINPLLLYHHRDWVAPVYGYFVAFPSLHVAQPLLAGWFVRKWKGVSTIIFAYCCFLVPAIVILRWHYIVDIVGGILVAALAAWIAPISLGKSSRPASEPAVKAESAQPSAS